MVGVYVIEFQSGGYRVFGLHEKGGIRRFEAIINQGRARECYSRNSWFQKTRSRLQALARNMVRFPFRSPVAVAVGCGCWSSLNRLVYVLPTVVPPTQKPTNDAEVGAPTLTAFVMFPL